MSIVHAIVLGITQGLSEFLPISSSGHLQLVPWLFGWDDFASRPRLELAFDVALHIGTFAGAVAYFRRDLVRLASAGLVALRPGRSAAGASVETGVRPAPDDVAQRPGLDDDGRLAWLLVVSAVPAAITGALLESAFEGWGEHEWLIALMLIGFGLVLLWADRIGGTRPPSDFRLRDALIMGGAQALALQPGVSRSGVTITAARAVGFDRDGAARLSFLMSLPIIGGAGLYKAVDVWSEGGIPSDFVPAFLWGMAAAAVTGWVAVWGTLKLVRTRTFTPFVAYRVAVGLGVLVVLATGLR